ncbi:hypothetical protein FDP41_008687 [Naegleria fowleri]|uniref:Uncharacterized protein n=1 Tax=Naegleria fowleri TaxID=5763 RepID=A0A6A5B0T3_NAEFO|nr:uncharacterized protein FDP41_008687 [Naegleria fowleri]KAF0973023.1 hypothetical protein FDP41_008687 [Naegleria fowleri]CAG4712785.1 unnamed protein product [Naegleria fowleri]
MLESHVIRIPKKSLEDEDVVMMGTPEKTRVKESIFSSRDTQQERAFSPPQHEEEQHFLDRYRYCFDEDIEECLIPEKSNENNTTVEPKQSNRLLTPKTIVKSKSTSTLDSKALKSFQEPTPVKNSSLAAASIYTSPHPKTPKTKKLTTSKSSQSLFPLQTSPSTPNTNTTPSSSKGTTHALQPISKISPKATSPSSSNSQHSARSSTIHITNRLIERRSSNTK